jgi:hypothetical protein
MPEMERQRAYYDTFQSGMITNVPPEEVPDTGVSRALNLVLDRQSNMKTREGVLRRATNHNLLQSNLDMAYPGLNHDATGESLIFDDGTGDRIAFGSPSEWPGQTSADGSFAVEIKFLWIATSGAQERLVSANDNTLGGFWFGMNGQDLQVVIHDGTAARTFKGPKIETVPDSWVHAAFVWDNPGRLLHLYCNGQVIRTWHHSDLDLSALSSTPGAQIYLGGNGAASNFNGNLADFRIWAKLRTHQEIADNWQSLTITGGDPDYLWFKLNDGSGTDVAATGTPAATIATPASFAATITAGASAWSSSGPVSTTNQTWQADHDNISSGTSIFDFGVGSDPFGGGTNSTAFDVSAYDAAHGSRATAVEVDPYQYTLVADLEPHDRTTIGMYFKRDVGTEAVTLATDPQSPDAVLYESNPAGLYVQLIDSTAVLSDRRFYLYGDYHEQAAAGQSWYALGVGSLTASMGARPSGSAMIQDNNVTTVNVGSGRGNVLPDYGTFVLYDSSWGLIGKYEGHRVGSNLYLKIPQTEEATFPTATVAYATADGAPTGAAVLSTTADIGRDTSTVGGVAFVDDGEDWTATAATSDDTATPGAGGRWLTSFNPEAGGGLGERPWVEFEWDAGTVLTDTIDVMIRAYAGDNGVITGSPGGDTTLDLVVYEEIDGVRTTIGSDTHDFAVDTDETFTISTSKYQGNKIIIRLSGNRQSYSGAGAFAYRYIDIVAAEVVSYGIEHLVMAGTESEVAAAARGDADTSKYGLREEGDWFQLWIEMDTTGYDTIAYSWTPFAGDHTFDATSGVYVPSSVTDIGTNTDRMVGDATLQTPLQLVTGAAWTNDNTDREVWGLELYPDRYRTDTPTGTSDSALNCPETSLATEFTTIYEHLDPTLLTRIYATGLNGNLRTYDETVAAHHFVWKLNATGNRWDPFVEEWDAVNSKYVFQAPNTTLYLDSPTTWAGYDGYAFLAAPDNQLISIDNATVSPQYVNTDNIDNNTNPATAYASDAPNLIYLRVWNNRLYGVEWDATNNIPTSVLKGTKVGSPDDWTDVSARSGSLSVEVAGSDSYPITGLAVFEQKLFIFTVDSTYFLQAGSPNVDLMQYNLQQWSSEAGCLSHRTIKTVAGDLTFLSREGVLTLKSVADQGNIERGLLSVAIEEFDRVSPEWAQQAVAFLEPSQSRYHIAFPADGGTKNAAMFVLDYTVQPAWTEWDGAVIGNDFLTLQHTTGSINTVLIAGRPVKNDTYAQVYKLYDAERYLDDGDWYQTEFRSKAYTQGDEILKKRYHRWFAKFRLEQPKLNLDGFYRYDLLPDRTEEFNLDFSDASTAGDKYGDAVYNTATYGGSASNVRTARYRMHGDQGRYAQSVQFVFTNTSSRDQGWTLVAMGFYFSGATSKYADT